MSNKREKNLWQEIDRMIFVMSILGIIILCGGYYIVFNLEDIPQVWRELIINTITNILPTFLLFIGAYIVFRRLEKLRTERDTDELADKVAMRFFEILSQIQANATNSSEDISAFAGEDLDFPIDMKLRHEFDVFVKPFDSRADPQKIIIECTNRGNNIVSLKKIKFSGSNLKQKEDLDHKYILDGFHTLIPVDHGKAEMLPGSTYTVELILAKTWKKNIIESWFGKLGYLFFDIEMGDQVVKDIQKAI